MNQFCPLPVDWLDYLDGQSESPDLLGKHLAGCPACRVLVASLKSTPVTTVSADWASSFDGRVDGVWHEERPETPARGEFWFSASDFVIGNPPFGTSSHRDWPSFGYENADRTLVLVVSHPEQDHGFDWLDVVPVRSDVERATETDFIFDPSENSLNVPWRAMFSYQTKVAREQLDTRVGTLGYSGVQTLVDVLNGAVDETRWGVPVQHPYDPRAHEDADFEETMRRLRTPWLLISGAAPEPVADATGTVEEFRLVSPKNGNGHGQASRIGQLFWLGPASGTGEELAFAAASSAPTRNFWALDNPAFRLVGQLKLNIQSGFLVFFVTEVVLKEAERLRLHVVAGGTEHRSEPFVPEPNTEVPVVQGVTPSAVEKVGAEVVA